MEGVSKQVKREVRHSFDQRRSPAIRKRLVHCVQRANGDVHRIKPALGASELRPGAAG